MLGFEVIEINCGVEEFDLKDCVLIWCMMGGKYWCLIGGVDCYVVDMLDVFCVVVFDLIGCVLMFDVVMLCVE